MKLEIQACTELKQLSEFTIQPKSEHFTIEPIAIYRSPCSLSKDTGRYTYRALFIGLEGMISVNNEDHKGKPLMANINRIRNPKFKPPKGEWSGTWKGGIFVIDKDAYERVRDIPWEYA